MTSVVPAASQPASWESHLASHKAKKESLTKVNLADGLDKAEREALGLTSPIYQIAAQGWLLDPEVANKADPANQVLSLEEFAMMEADIKQYADTFLDGNIASAREIYVKQSGLSRRDLRQAQSAKAQARQEAGKEGASLDEIKDKFGITNAELLENLKGCDTKGYGIIDRIFTLIEASKFSADIQTSVFKVSKPITRKYIGAMDLASIKNYLKEETKAPEPPKPAPKPEPKPAPAPEAKPAPKEAKPVEEPKPAEEKPKAEESMPTIDDDYQLKAPGFGGRHRPGFNLNGE